MQRRSTSCAARLALACTFSALVAAACGKESGPRIETREVDYTLGETTMKGFVAFDAAAAGKRPGVVIVHEWWGNSQHERNQAQRLAQAGYVAFALDMYGSGKTTNHPQDAGTFAGEASRDPGVMLARFNAGLEQLRQDPHVDPERIGAIGYCFGGMVVLSAARAGADLDAVVSFHGALPKGKVDSGAVKARVLVLTGGADGFVPATAVEAFHNEMEAAGSAVRIVTYRNAKHGFTNPEAGTHGMEQLAYDSLTDKASWLAMRALFHEVWP